MNNPSKPNVHPLGKAAAFFGLCIAGIILAAIVSAVLLLPLDISPESKPGLQIQTLLSQIIGFLLPAGIFIRIFGLSSVSGFSWNKLSLKFVFLAILIAVSGVIFSTWLGQINKSILESAGSAYESIKSFEEQAELILKNMLDMRSLSDLGIALFLVALTPAICEEVAFRGVLQSQLSKAFKNHHLGIWATAIIFSTIHFQFLGFLPRMVLGAIFGYLLVHSGGILACIIAHFINNALGVISYYVALNTDYISVEELESSEVSLLMGGASLLIIFLLFIVLTRVSVWSNLRSDYLKPS